MVIIAPQAIQDLLDELEASRAWVFLTKTAELAREDGREEFRVRIFAHIAAAAALVTSVRTILKS